MKILLIGGSGQLGTDLLRNNSRFDIVAPPRHRLDLLNTEFVAAEIGSIRPDMVINCAAFHDVPLCETEPETAFRVNCIAVRRLAEHCAMRSARLVTFSTDYVFCGDKREPYREDDLPAPVQVYGITKLAGEHAALAVEPEAVTVIRTCGLYGRAGSKSKGGNFVDNRIRDARAGLPLDISSDQTVAPTSTDDLSRSVLQLIAHPNVGGGIYHLINEGQCTWYEFTRAIYDLIGARSPLRPFDRKGRTGAMRRPLYSALANTRARALGIALPPWQDALRRYLAGVRLSEPA